MPTDEEIAAQKAEQDAAAKAAEEAAATAKADETDDLGDKGKEAIRKEREARKAAEKERDELRRVADEAAAAKAKADEEQAAKNGEFERLATERQAKLEQTNESLKALTAERDALQERLQAREDQDKVEIGQWIKDHKGQIDDLLDFYPGQDAPVDQQLDWYAKARKRAADRTANPVRGNGRSPEFAGSRDGKADAEAIRVFEHETRRKF